MREIAKLYYFYKSVPVVFIRLGIFIVLFLSTFFAISHHTSYKVSLFLLLWYIMGEIFFRFSLSKQTPKVTVENNNGKNEDSVTLLALSLLVTHASTEQLLKHVWKFPQIQFLLEKADITLKELEYLSITHPALLAEAGALVKALHGQYITTMDIVAAYLLLTEDKTRLLFQKQVKKEEFLQILSWARASYPEEEHPKPKRMQFTGEGIGEEWVFGWTIETQKYMIDRTQEVLRKRPTIFGREKEYKELLSSLYNNKSVLLVGEPGVGKEALVLQIAGDSMGGVLSGSLRHQRVFELMVDALLAGSENQGALEERLGEVIAEISHAGNVLIYIPDFQRVLGASSFHLDLSGALLPYLSKGVFRIIGSCTPGTYKQYVEPLSSLVDALTVVTLEESNREETLGMLFERTLDIEKAYRVSLTYRAVVVALELGKKYAQGKVLPGSAITLLEDTANACSLQKIFRVEEKDVIMLVENKTKIPLGIPGNQERDMLLHFEDRMHERLIDQEEGVKAISEAMRRIRAEGGDRSKPISFLFLGPTGVGKTETAKALAALYFGNEASMLRFDMSEYGTEDGMKRLLGSLPGEAIGKGTLPDAVFDHPFSLVLLDEFEKANPKILNLFLQVLDDGRLTDNSGKTVSFTDTIIIATSNAGSEYIREALQKGVRVDKTFTHQVLEYLQTNNLFRPELLNRFDDVIVFKPLGKVESEQITKLFLGKLAKRFTEQDITVAFSQEVIEKIVREGFDAEFGARPLSRYIQDTIEDTLSQKILRREIGRGSNVTVSVGSTGEISIA